MKYKVSGTVIRGDQQGRGLGFPTANLDTPIDPSQQEGLKEGVYAGYVTIARDIKRRAGIVLRARGKSDFLYAEAHILEYDQNIYGKEVMIELVLYIRPYDAFSDLLALQSAIEKDLIAVRALDIDE